MSDLSNNPVTQDSVLKKLKGLGKMYGEGQNSRPNAAAIAVDAASRGVFKPTDAKEVYEAFAAAAAAHKGVEFKVTASHDVQVSKMKQFLTLGGLPNGIDGVVVFEQAHDAIMTISQRPENPLKGSAYDLLCKVARRQIGSPKVQLSKDEIESILLEAPADKDDVTKVIDAYKRLHTLGGKLAENAVNVEHIDTACEELAEQIVDMGGTVPPMTAKEKEIAKAEELLAKNGLAVSYAPAPCAQPEDADTLPIDAIQIVGSLLQAAE